MIVNRKSLTSLRVLTDLILLNVCFFLTQLIVVSTDTISLRTFNVMIILNVAWLLIARLSRLYDDYRANKFSFLFIAAMKASIYFLLVMIVGYFLLREYFMGRPRVFIITYSIFFNITILAKEITLRKLLKYFRKKGKNKRNLVIIGTNEIGYEFSKMVKEFPEFGYNLLGFIGEQTSLINGKYLGKYEELENIFTRNKVHEVIISLPDKSQMPIDKLLRLCNKHAVRVKIIPDYARFLSKKFQTTRFGEFPIITVRSDPLEEVQWRFLKRAFDIIFSLTVILCFCSWLCPIIALFIKLDSKGPVIFSQTRVGQDSKKFKAYKFRTMHPKDDKALRKYTPLESETNRITKVGRVLRKTNLDELPQFYNVLIGDMSVVGPRPHAISFEEKYSEFVEEMKLRHLVKPGITGWAQVNGLRGDFLDDTQNKAFTQAKFAYDIWYIENWSFWLDIYIIFLTVWKMLSGQTEGR